MAALASISMPDRAGLPSARKHRFTLGDFAQLQAGSRTRRCRDHSQAAAAERQLEDILGRHGVSLGDCDNAVLARVDATIGLSADEARAAIEQLWDAAEPVDHSCPGCRQAGQGPRRRIALLPDLPRKAY